MLWFDCDYNKGCADEIMERISAMNDERYIGYGEDEICEKAAEKIRQAVGLPDAYVKFLVGGTQTNLVAITASLRLTEGVIAAKTGHIYVHECGAIEHAGHKVIDLPSHNGKLDPEEVAEYMKHFYADSTYPHMVKPAMVYISHPTEYGSLYTKDELKRLHEICETYKMKLYVDGARLGYALGAKKCDVTLKTLGEYTDMFYIGGTKMGALFGEALVIKDKTLLPDFFSIMKQSGAVLAKGWLLGAQFDVLFTDGLYEKIGRRAVELALTMKKGFIEKGYRTYMDSETNQQFFIIEKKKLPELEKKVSFSAWEDFDDDNKIVRFATSFATTSSDVEELLKLI